MEYRRLRRSGLQVSEIAYGNWLTHEAQIDDGAATRCVHAALIAGITMFDAADAYTSMAAESVLGKLLKSQRRLASPPARFIPIPESILRRHP